MSPINIMYIILGITAALIFVIIKYVKGDEAESTVIEAKNFIHEDEKKSFVDFRDLKLSSENQKITSKEF